MLKNTRFTAWRCRRYIAYAVILSGICLSCCCDTDHSRVIVEAASERSPDEVGASSEPPRDPPMPVKWWSARSYFVEETPPAPVMPELSSEPIELGKEPPSLGVDTWPDGNTESGGQGETIDDITCAVGMAETYHAHAHLAIFLDGVHLALPRNVGILEDYRCLYQLHTHDTSGIVHVEAETYSHFTLGQFFAIWGQPLSSSNVAGITDKNVRLFVDDNMTLTELTEAWESIELNAHRSITISIGEPPQIIPSYSWTDGL